MKQSLAFLSIIFAVSFITAECMPRKHVLLCTGVYATPKFPLLPDTVGSGSVYSDYQKVDTLTDGLCGDTISLLNNIELNCRPTIPTGKPPMIILNGHIFRNDLSAILPSSIDSIIVLKKQALERGVILITTKRKK